MSPTILKLHDRCLLCDRPLKSQKSRIRGYGPNCWLKIRQSGKSESPSHRIESKKNEIRELSKFHGHNPSQIDSFTVSSSVNKVKKSPIPLYKNKEYLKEEFLKKGRSIGDIARSLRVSHATVRTYLIKYGLYEMPTSPTLQSYKSTARCFDDGWLKKAYLEDKLTISEIARICGERRSTIRKRLKQLNIYKKPQLPSTFDLYNDTEWLRKKYIEENWSITQIAYHCGVSRRAIQKRLHKFGIFKRELPEGGELSQSLFDLGTEWEFLAFEVIIQALDQSIIDSVKIKKKEEVGTNKKIEPDFSFSMAGKVIVGEVKLTIGAIQDKDLDYLLALQYDQFWLWVAFSHMTLTEMKKIILRQLKERTDRRNALEELERKLHVIVGIEGMIHLLNLNVSSKQAAYWNRLLTEIEKEHQRALKVNEELKSSMRVIHWRKEQIKYLSSALKRHPGSLKVILSINDLRYQSIRLLLLEKPEVLVKLAAKTCFSKNELHETLLEHGLQYTPHGAYKLAKKFVDVGIRKEKKIQKKIIFCFH